MAGRRNLYNFVAGGVLEEDEVEAALLAAADACGLLAEEPRQTRLTIWSGRKAGLAHPRGKPSQPNEAGTSAAMAAESAFAEASAPSADDRASWDGLVERKVRLARAKCWGR